jgi:hypothetical protein
LQAGDATILEVTDSFFYENRRESDFVLIRGIEGYQVQHVSHALVALTITVAMMALAAFNVTTMLNAALLATAAMLVTGCLTIQRIWDSLDWRTVVVLGAAGSSRATSGDTEMKTRAVFLSTLLFSLILILAGCSTTPTTTTSSASQPAAAAATDPLPSWNNGPAKQAIIDFVKTTTDKSNPKFVAPEDRIATFDQDGTTWVEHPIYSQVLFMFDRVVALAPQHPEWKTKQPFKAIVTGDKEAIAKLTLKDIEVIGLATSTGTTTEEFQAIVKDWMATAKHPRYDKPYPQMVYQPMLEVMKYLRDNGYKTYIVTGGGQDFVRAYAQQVYGISPEQVIGSALETQYGYNKEGQGVLMRAPKLLLNNNFSGKPEDIYLFLGRHPKAAFGNSTGDQQMEEYTQANGGASLMMMVLHDDATREYAYGPAQGLPDSPIGTFSQALYDEAKAKGWTVISMKNDWKQIFAWEK